MKTYFKFDELRTTYKKEFIGAFSTFSAMVYIIFVHPSILSTAGLSFGAVMTVTILITAFSTFLMGMLGKVPFAVAPAMGVSAYFSFTLIQKNHLAASIGLFIIFLAALCILFMNFFHLRKKILNSIPDELLIGITGGIGLFLIAVGLKQIGIVTLNGYGFITLNSVDPAILTLSALGLFLIFLFQRLRWDAAFILSILINWIISCAFGLSNLDGIFAFPPSIKDTFFLLELPKTFSYEFFKGFLSIFLVTLFDSSAGLISLKKSLPKEAQNFDMQKALYPDAIGSLTGSLLGTSSLAIHLESMAGIHGGARSGFASIIVSGLFLSCLFFYPLASSVPTFASAPVIISIGLLMARQLKELLHLPWIKKITPFTTAIIMPLTLSLYQGFKLGFILLGLIGIIFPKKMPISKTIFVFFILFAFEQILEISHRYF